MEASCNEVVPTKSRDLWRLTNHFLIMSQSREMWRLSSGGSRGVRPGGGARTGGSGAGAGTTEPAGPPPQLETEAWSRRRDSNSRHPAWKEHARIRTQNRRMATPERVTSAPDEQATLGTVIGSVQHRRHRAPPSGRPNLAPRTDPEPSGDRLDNGNRTGNRQRRHSTLGTGVRQTTNPTTPLSAPPNKRIRQSGSGPQVGEGSMNSAAATRCGVGS